MALKDLEIMIEQEKIVALEVSLAENLEICVKQGDVAVYIHPEKVRDLLDALVLTLRAGSMINRRVEEVKRGRDNQRNNRQVPDQGCTGRDQWEGSVRRAESV